ncbi:type II secretion system protein [Gehongia tenuis]|uniref:Prepilin-type N-terminal cleavage/methylation domain-containing protein n=1 Tax=Gehongia tenuis TaxID=2763655 RepID=A0A926D3H1_9FIRM|nr:prepilin-type N-terminal cleavage/methylation domain-containing protein [Gehongia tenuis]MBC8531068.1 prepilin-type N-terminal cleavage/methylation domain-containing protein [Gehongia tenuis]
MNKKGYTLVEAIVAIAVAGIFCLCAAMVITPILNSYRRIAATSDGQLIAGNVLDAIRNKAAYATALNASSSGEAIDLGNGIIAVSEEGYLVVNDELQFARSYYNGKTLGMTVEQAGQDRVDVTVSVRDWDREIYTVTATVAPLRNVLTRTYSIYEPEGMRQAAQEVVKGYEGTGWGANDKSFYELYNQVYGGSFPEYSLDNILSAEKRQAMLDEFYATHGSSDPGRFRYESMVHNAHYLVPFITKDTLVPLIYVTDMPKNATHTRVTMLYYNFTWYYPVKDWGYFLPGFNGLTDEEIAAKLSDTTQWIPVSQLR